MIPHNNQFAGLSVLFLAAAVKTATYFCAVFLPLLRFELFRSRFFIFWCQKTKQKTTGGPRTKPIFLPYIIIVQSVSPQTPFCL